MSVPSITHDIMVPFWKKLFPDIPVETILLIVTAAGLAALVRSMLKLNEAFPKS